MPVVPSKLVDKIQFFEDHIEPWTTNAVAIGTTTTAVTALETKTAAARTAYDAQQIAHAAAQSATEALRQAVREMSVAGSAIIDQVRAAAKTTGPGVYPLAQIPAPATPTPAGPPGKPTDFAVALGENGALKLSWKCNNPAGTTGTIYQVWRKLDGGPFTFCGSVGARSYLDSTVPPGTINITYQLQAVRSTAVGPWAQFNVNFSTLGGATITETEPVKMAA